MTTSPENTPDKAKTSINSIPTGNASGWRPFVFINMAMTADGKIATANRQIASFGSRHDQQHLFELRAQADAVMAGARTLEAGEITLGPGAAKYRRERLRRGLAEYNLRIIVSGSGSINPEAEIFKHSFSPILILCTQRAEFRVKQLSRLVDEIKTCGREQLAFPEALAWLKSRWKVNRLLVEGGGELNGALLEAGLVDQLHLTVCPRVFGGRQAPTIADGLGVARLVDACKFNVQSFKRVKNEIYLVMNANRLPGNNPTHPKPSIQ